MAKHPARVRVAPRIVRPTEVAHDIVVRPRRSLRIEAQPRSATVRDTEQTGPTPNGGVRLFAPQPSELRSEAAPTGQVVACVPRRRSPRVTPRAASARSRSTAGSRCVPRTTMRPAGPTSTSTSRRWRTRRAPRGSKARPEGPHAHAMRRATLRGVFDLAVPIGVDARAFGGAAIWRDTYSVLFGYAEPSPS